MSTVISSIIKLVGLFGFRLSGFWAGAIVAGILAAGFAGYSGYLVKTGYDWAEGKCTAAALRKENEQLAAALAEAKRQLAVASEIQKADAQRAADAEQRLQSNEAAINATPSNSGKCLDRSAVSRVRNVH